MQNYGEPFYFTKELQLGSSKVKINGNEESNEPFSVSFHPEGGGLIANLSNRLLIKIHTADGESDNIHGEIIDS